MKISFIPWAQDKERGWDVDKTKATIIAIVVVAIAALILVTVLTSVIKTIVEVAVVVGAIYLIAQVMRKKR